MSLLPSQTLTRLAGTTHTSLQHRSAVKTVWRVLQQLLTSTVVWQLLWWSVSWLLSTTEVSPYNSQHVNVPYPQLALEGTMDCRHASLQQRLAAVRSFTGC